MGIYTGSFFCAHLIEIVVYIFWFYLLINFVLCLRKSHGWLHYLITLSWYIICSKKNVLDYLVVAFKFHHKYTTDILVNEILKSHNAVDHYCFDKMERLLKWFSKFSFCCWCLWIRRRYEIKEHFAGNLESYLNLLDLMCMKT